VALHQLAPLVVHAIKFGGSYVAATQRALDVVVRAL
jgi:fructosamine-3-kinase